MKCPVCEHEKLHEINEKILSRNLGADEITLEKIATEYDVPLRALQIHAVRHFSAPNDPASLTDKIALNEASMLREVAFEYYNTMKNIGRKLNGYINANDHELMKAVTSTTVGLYLGAGKAVNDTVAQIINMNQAINGDKNSGAEALASLIGAIHASAPEPSPQDYGDVDD